MVRGWGGGGARAALKRYELRGGDGEVLITSEALGGRNCNSVRFFVGLFKNEMFIRDLNWDILTQ